MTRSHSLLIPVRQVTLFAMFGILVFTGFSASAKIKIGSTASASGRSASRPKR
jgi:hypothetical protein